ncbi:MAG TPA: hypothetical protein VFW91_19990 [Candidatus Binatia bacterium]|nr:hypothetical protein [Candidatus Binatia bacterium]
MWAQSQVLIKALKCLQFWLGKYPGDLGQFFVGNLLPVTKDNISADRSWWLPSILLSTCERESAARKRGPLAVWVLAQFAPNTGNNRAEGQHREDVNNQHDKQQTKHRPYQDEVVLVSHEERRKKVYQRQDSFSYPIEHRC